MTGDPDLVIHQWLIVNREWRMVNDADAQYF